MAEKKVKWKPSNQEYCFIKQTDDKPGKLVVGTFGDTNVVTEFDVGGSASAGVNTLNGLQGDVALISTDSSIQINISGQSIDLKAQSSSENYQLLSFQVETPSSTYLYNFTSSYTEYTNWSDIWTELIKSADDNVMFGHTVTLYHGPDTEYYPTGTLFYNVTVEAETASFEGYDLYVSKLGASLCATNANGTFGNGLTVIDSGVHVDYNNTKITMNDNGINLTNNDKSITLVATGFDIDGDTFEIKTTAQENNTEIQINSGTLKIDTYDDSGKDMTYVQDPLIGIQIGYQNNSESMIENQLHFDDTGIYITKIEDDNNYYLNYFMTTPNSSNPIATQADLNAIPAIDMHNDGVEITGDATLSSISNCIHTHNGTLNTIIATIEYTANTSITDNNTYITLDTEEFIIPATFPVIAYDTTINNSIQLRWLGNNIWSLAGSEANHTYIITLYYSYVEGGNN